MECVAPTYHDTSVALDHGVKAIQKALASLDFKHQLLSLSEASVYFRERQIPDGHMHSSSHGTTINQVMSLGFTLLQGNFAVKTVSIYFSDKYFDGKQGRSYNVQVDL